MRKLCGVVLLLAAGIGCVRAESVDKLPQPTSYVSDFAGVIDPVSKQDIDALCAELEQKAHSTIEVATIKSLDGQDIDEFTTALEDKWKVGPKGSDKGVLMVLAIQDRKDRIEVGYGLEGVLNDAKVGDIRRSMNPLLEQGQYGPAVQLGVQQLATDIAQDAGVTLTPPQNPVMALQPVQQHRGFNWMGLIIPAIFLLMMFRRGGRGGGWGWFLLGSMMGGGFGGGGGGGSGGGGFGGGGGGDFGGGFGGGSGGGGASGGW